MTGHQEAARVVLLQKMQEWRFRMIKTAPEQLSCIAV